MAKVTMSSVARSLSGLALCIFSIAARASGVAALPIPRMFADRAAQISSFPCPDFQVLGNTRRSMGDRILESFCTAPASRRTSMMPLHRHMAPAREKIREIAFVAPSTTAFDTSERFPVETAKKTDIETRTKKHFSIIKLHQPLDNLCKNDIIFSRKINNWEELYEIFRNGAEGRRVGSNRAAH